MRTPGFIILMLSVALLTGCEESPGQVLGTLERDRISLPAPVFERIAEIPVREGMRVDAGATLLRLESARTAAHLVAAQAEVARLTSALDEARNGPRRESIEEARAQVRRTESVADNARREFNRVATVVERKLLPAAELDRARSAAEAADADAAGARSALDLLVNGTRSEQLSQAASALAAARAQVDSLTVDLERTRITAPRSGVVDSLPFRVGDQVTVGTPLATLLVGDAPYARVYVPQPLRTGLAIGARANVYIAGETIPHPATLRSIRSEPGFTPYYALTGDDAARLMYLAEVLLDDDAAALPAGLPVRVEFGTRAAQ